MRGHLAWHNAVNVKMARHISRKIYSYIPEVMHYVLLLEAKQMFVKENHFRKRPRSENMKE